MQKILSLVLLGCVALAASQSCQQAETCDPATCQPPDCACSLTVPDIPLEQRPQIVYLTFDDAFTALTEENYYHALFDGTFVNPNGCPIRATHFLTHQSTDYFQVNQYYNLGHEMASHSITHRYNTSYWANLDQFGWTEEIGGMKAMITKYAGIPAEDIMGMRSPYLQGGGDVMIEMLKEQGFQYDCTSPSREYGYLNMENGAWPFTYDYRSDMDCQIGPCPRCAHSGVWSQPMLDLEDSWPGSSGDPDHGSPCDMVDSCIIISETGPDDALELLYRNFERAYYGNTRAPIGFYMHSAWFYANSYRYEGYQDFLAEITSYDDVWIVPVHAGLEYRKNPMTNDELIANGLPAFNCDSYPQITCDAGSDGKTCAYYNVTNADLDLFEIRMKICDTVCPEEYPWLGNPFGEPTPAPTEETVPGTPGTTAGP